MGGDGGPVSAVGRKVMGTSAISIPVMAARITISDANSIPIVRRSNVRYASIVIARIPQ